MSAIKMTCNKTQKVKGLCMCFKTTKWASEQICGNASQKLVLTMLAVYKNSETGQCDPSHAHLAERCCMSQSSLKTQLRALARSGKIKIIEKSVNGGRLANQYDLRMPKNYPLSEPENKPNVFKFSGKSSGEADSTGVTGQNLPGGSAEFAGGVGQTLPVADTESDYKYINKYSSLSPLLNGLEEIYFWAVQHSFWGKLITSEEKFLDLYANQKPNSLRSQYEALVYKSTEKDRRHAHQYNNFHGKNRRQLTPVEQIAQAAGFSFD